MQSVDLVNVAGDWHFGNNGYPVFLVKNERAIEIVFNECLSVTNHSPTMVGLIVKGARLELPVRWNLKDLSSQIISFKNSL